MWPLAGDLLSSFSVYLLLLPNGWISLIALLQEAQSYISSSDSCFSLKSSFILSIYLSSVFLFLPCPVLPSPLLFSYTCFVLPQNLSLPLQSGLVPFRLKWNHTENNRDMFFYYKTNGHQRNRKAASPGANRALSLTELLN